MDNLIIRIMFLILFISCSDGQEEIIVRIQLTTIHLILTLQRMTIVTLHLQQLTTIQQILTLQRVVIVILHLQPQIIPIKKQTIRKVLN